MAGNPFITRKLFSFFRDLKNNNTREWFEANKDRYESDVREPLLTFIDSFAEPLYKISPHFRADARKVGGSLFRIYRDVRFSKDKTPYKTQAGVHFRHERSKDAHAPGFYLHLDPKEVFIGAGIWHPDKDALLQIRGALMDPPPGRKPSVAPPSAVSSPWRESPTNGPLVASTRNTHYSRTSCARTSSPSPRPHVPMFLLRTFQKSSPARVRPPHHW
jgi:uncharacterized protein (DUF2461 family)